MKSVASEHFLCDFSHASIQSRMRDRLSWSRVSRGIREEEEICLRRGRPGIVRKDASTEFWTIQCTWKSKNIYIMHALVEKMEIHLGCINIESDPRLGTSPLVRNTVGPRLVKNDAARAIRSY